MNAITAFENRKEALREQLLSAQTMEQAMAACQMALEQTACELAQNEQDEHARQRQQAVMALARRAPQLLRAARAKGELMLGKAQEEDEAGKGRTVFKVMKIMGMFILASLAVHEWLGGETLFALAQLLGSLTLLLGMLPEHKTGMAREYQARGIPDMDPEATVRMLQELCQAADICVSDLMMIEQDTGMMRLSGTADDTMLDLLCVLMEAKASGRNEMAMRSLSQAEQYLHMLGVDMIFYGNGRDELFDLLPTMGETRTIRPAMIRDGKLLRRGTAACRMERSVQG